MRRRRTCGARRYGGGRSSCPRTGVQPRQRGLFLAVRSDRTTGRDEHGAVRIPRSSTGRCERLRPRCRRRRTPSPMRAGRRLGRTHSRSLRHVSRVRRTIVAVRARQGRRRTGCGRATRKSRTASAGWQRAVESRMAKARHAPDRSASAGLTGRGGYPTRLGFNRPTSPKQRAGRLDRPTWGRSTPLRRTRCFARPDCAARDTERRRHLLRAVGHGGCRRASGGRHSRRGRCDRTVRHRSRCGLRLAGSGPAVTASRSAPCISRCGFRR